MKPHKHAELIKAWLDDPSIKFEVASWDLDRKTGEATPVWVEVSVEAILRIRNDDNTQIRIKPEPKPDVVLYFGLGLNIESCGEYVVYSNTPWGCHQPTKKCNLKLTWGGETGKLKDAEVLK